MLSKLFNLPWPPRFFWVDCGCCDCVHDTNCDATISWQFAIAGVVDDTDICCSDLNATYNLTGNTPVWSGSVSGSSCSFSYIAVLDWPSDDFADLDIYTREVGNATVFFAHLSEGKLSLDHDSHPVCITTPLPPEKITTSPDYTTPTTFEAWYNQFSSCAPETSPTKNTATIKNNGSEGIKVNDTIVTPGFSFTHTPEYGGYDKGNQSSFVPSVQIVVECCPGITASLSCVSGTWSVVIQRDGAEVAVYEKTTDLDCCNDQVFDLISNSDSCTSWPSTITLTPSGASCP